MRFESPVITSHKTGPVQSLTDYVSRSWVNMVLNCSNNWDSASVIKISSLNRINIHSPHTDKACSYKNTNMMRCLSVSVRSHIKSHHIWYEAPQSQLWQRVSFVKEPAFTKEQWRKNCITKSVHSSQVPCHLMVIQGLGDLNWQRHQFSLWQLPIPDLPDQCDDHCILRHIPISLGPNESDSLQLLLRVCLTNSHAYWTSVNVK